MRFLLAILLATPLFAGGSAAWESHSYPDFVKGRFSGISLTRDGRLTLAPRLDAIFSSGDAGVWSIAQSSDGSLFLGTGHRGRLYKVDSAGKAAPVWVSPQPEIFALAAGPAGAIFAGTSPDGRVWKITGNQAVEFFNPQSKYIWALALAPDGHLFVGTGDNGRIYRVSPSGQGELWYETGQSHVTSLAIGRQGDIIAGTEPNGIIYRITGKDKAFVLYDSPLPEIRSLVVLPDGSVYAAALGGSVTQRQAQSASDAVSTHSVPSVSTTITVTADASAQQGGIELKPRAGEAKPQPAFVEAAPPTSPIFDMSGVEKSAIYKIHPDNMVETLWSSKEENVFDLAVDGSDITFSTDQRGRIYRLNRDLKSILLVETREGETTRLLSAQPGLLAATSNLGKLFRLSKELSAAGSYESPVHDAGNAARWGRIEWRAEPGSGSIAFRTRTGNSERPDKTWSDWSEPVSNPDSSRISSPNARFIQWRLEMKGGSGAPPILDSVTLTFQPQNGRPIVRSVQAYPQWVASAAKQAPQTTASNAAYSITVTDSGSSPAQATSAGTPTQIVGRSGRPQIYISWAADDPDGDTLVYDLHYRAQDERRWKLLKDNLTENTFVQDAEVFADGRYYFRVTASDRSSNDSSSAFDSDLVSQPVLLDLSPPRVAINSARRDGAGITLSLSAEDSASPIRKAEYSLNGGPWHMVQADDSITDSRVEQFTIRVSAPQGEETTIVVRITDAAGNPGLAKSVLN